MKHQTSWNKLCLSALVYFHFSSSVEGFPRRFQQRTCFEKFAQAVEIFFCQNIVNEQSHRLNFESTQLQLYFLWFLAEQFLFTSHRVSRRRGASKQRRVPLWFESICSAAIAAVKLPVRGNLTQFEHDPKYIVTTTTTAATTTTTRTMNESKFRVFRT